MSAEQGSMVEVGEKRIEVLIPEKELVKREKELAAQIIKDYDGKDVLLVPILDGAAYFGIDLHRELPRNFKIDFMKVDSGYEGGTYPSKQPRIIMDVQTDIKDKHVIVVEDIADTGYTLQTLLDMLSVRHPASLKICVLLTKKERRQKEVKLDYVGFDIPNFFVVGWGLDSDKEFRNQKFVGVVTNP